VSRAVPADAFELTDRIERHLAGDLIAWLTTVLGSGTLIEPGALAYALVRLGESFLYADVLVARKPDVATAYRLQQALIEGILP
jgi:hypothetical protein